MIYGAVIADPFIPPANIVGLVAGIFFTLTTLPYCSRKVWCMATLSYCSGGVQQGAWLGHPNSHPSECESVKQLQCEPQLP